RRGRRPLCTCERRRAPYRPSSPWRSGRPAHPSWRAAGRRGRLRPPGGRRAEVRSSGSANAQRGACGLGRQSVGREGLEQRWRGGARLQGLLVHADEHLPSSGAQETGLTPDDVEIDGHGTGADLADVRGHREAVVEAGGHEELRVDGAAWKEDPVAVENVLVGQAGRTEELSFGDFEKTDVRAVENDAGVVYVRPADVLLDEKRARRIRHPREARSGFPGT